MKHKILSLLIVLFAAIGYAQPTLTTGGNQFICEGASAQLNVNATGGTAPYSYAWSNGTTLSSAIIANPIATPLATTTYTVTVTDGASASATASILVTVYPSPVLSVNTSASPSSVCLGSVIDISASILPQACGVATAGGNPFNAVVGSGSQIQSGNSLQMPGLLSNFQKSSRQQMLYTFGEMNTASNGPKVIKSIAFNLGVFNSNAVLQNVVVKIGCTSQTSLSNWETGLTTVYTAATYTPVSGWNTITLQSPYYYGNSNVVIEICTYNSVTSGNMINKALCTNTLGNLYLYASSASDLCGSASTPTVSQERPNVRFNFADEANPIYYGYYWNAVGNTTFDTITHTYIQAKIYDTSTYTAYVTNSYGCSDSASITISPDLGRTALTVDSIVPTGTTCGLNNGALTAHLSGCGGYTYSWSNGATTNPITSLNPSIYYGWFTDCNNCMSSGTGTVLSSSSISLSPTITHVSCNGGNNGSICLVASGTTGPYVYTWSNAAVGSCINNLSAGFYTVTVSDMNGCTASATYTINQPALLQLLATPLHVSCSGANDGAIDLTVAGGTPPYLYSWSNGLQTQDLGTLLAAPYTVTVTDNNLCSATVTTTVLQPSPVAVSFSNIVDASSCGASDGSACAVPSGGTAPYTYFWSNLSSASCISNVPAGTYIITVTDPNGCTASANVNVGAANSNMSIIVDSIFNAICFGDLNGAIYISISGGTAPYNYSWSNSSVTEDQTNLPAGGYVLTVTDNGGCVDIDTFFVTESTSPLLLDSVVSVNARCYGTGDGASCLYVSGGVTPYTYVWGPPLSNSACQTQLVAGTYAITVVDNNNCTISAFLTITEPTQLVASITITGDTLLPDTLNAVATGGTPPYSYVWSNNVITQTNEVVVADDYRLTITDANNCLDTAHLLVGCVDTCVWPGDADYSGTADNNDLLAIGLAYGATGSARTDQSIAWYAHPSINWITYLGDTTNYKHIDSNGDGVVNSDDTLAIIQNYYLQHPRSGPDEVRGGIPSLRIRMVPDTLEDGETLIAHLELGDANSTAMNVYGLAFTFNFDALVVDTNEVYIAFEDNSWLCNTSTDHIDIDKKDLSAGQIHTALTRIDHTTRSGGGEIGKVSMKITTGNINGKDLANYVMNTYITNLRVIDNMGNVLDVDAIGDAANVQYEPTGINEVSWKGEVSLYPNPAKDQLIISSPKTAITGVKITNLIGETVFAQQDLATARATINTALFAQGVYVLQLSSGNRVYYAKFIVVK